MPISTNWSTPAIQSSDWSSNAYYVIDLGVLMGDTVYLMGDTVATIGDAMINPLFPPSTNWAGEVTP